MGMAAVFGVFDGSVSCIVKCLSNRREHPIVPGGMVKSSDFLGDKIGGQRLHEHGLPPVGGGTRQVASGLNL